MTRPNPYPDDDKSLPRKPPQKRRPPQVYLPEMRPASRRLDGLLGAARLAPPVRALPRHAAQPAPAAPPPGEPVPPHPPALPADLPPARPLRGLPVCGRLPHPRRAGCPARPGQSRIRRVFMIDFSFLAIAAAPHPLEENLDFLRCFAPQKFNLKCSPPLQGRGQGWRPGVDKKGDL